MSRWIYSIPLLAAFLLAPFAVMRAADPAPPTTETGSTAELDRKLQWSFTPAPALPNVLILGDSISIGYTLQVRQLLQGKANVFRPMLPDGNQSANCNGTAAGVQHIDRWLAGRQWAVIHFNWGLHDLRHVTAAGTGQSSNNPVDPVEATVDEYRRNLEVIVGKLQATGARLVFATTTPVAPGTTNPLREPAAPVRYNTAAVQIMHAHDIRVDDLFALCEPQLTKLQLPHNVHFTRDGSREQARQAAAAIEQELAALPKPAK